MQGHLFLIGFMGSGKSRWGARLASHLELPFVDLDYQIEQEEQKSIAEIFAREGETGFRAVEQKHLHALADQPDTVVALGGGTPCFFDNMTWINRHGRSFYLKVPLDTLIERLQRKGGHRPLLAQLPPADWPEILGKMLLQRAPYYEQASQTVAYASDDDAFFTQLCGAAGESAGKKV